MSLWAEIRQRRVTQIVLAYLAGGWMVLAVVDQVVDREVFPDWVYRVFLTLYLFGIAVALILGWYHGEKGVQKATPLEIVLVTLVTAAGLGASGRIVLREMRAGAARDAIESSLLDLRKIGVLYFRDQSPDGSLAVVADGITEGLISALAQVGELDVISRNGSQAVRDLDASPDSVAALLGAGTLIDGSVTSSGDQLTVTVRLLDGQSGTVIDRDVFEAPSSAVASVSDQLATEVAQALRVVLGHEIRLRESRSRAPTSAAWLQMARAQKSLKDAQQALRRGQADAALEALALADQEASRAAEAGDWSSPKVLRGRIAYERLAFAESADEFVGTVEQAVSFADAALASAPDDAAAFELRGKAKYRRWLLHVDPASAQDRLLADARADLERAVDLDSSRAGAYSALSHLYYQLGDVSGAVIQARQAYQEDAFLEAADEVLWRLYSGTYDLEQYDQARQWCLEGYRRFPENFRFVQCQLFLMTMNAANPDIDRAWQLGRQLEAMVPDDPQMKALAQTVVGGIIGRAGLLDSANAVMVRARLSPQQDPEGELASFEAAFRSVMGDTEGAIEILKPYIAAHPDHFGGRTGLHWWWRNLQGNPDFERFRAAR